MQTVCRYNDNHGLHRNYELYEPEHFSAVLMVLHSIAAEDLLNSLRRIAWFEILDKLGLASYIILHKFIYSISKTYVERLFRPLHLRPSFAVFYSI
jgi:hypothetical protein